MDVKAKFFKLKKEWKDSDENGRQLIEREIDMFLNSLSEEQKKEVCEAVNDDFKEINAEIEDIKKTVNIRKALEPVLELISISYLAKKYFNKTPQWFYQRMNGNKVNGKPASFSDAEIQRIYFAIQDISKQLSEIGDYLLLN